MIVEVAPLRIRPGHTAEFEIAFKQAQRIIASMPGYLSHELLRCLERRDEYRKQALAVINGDADLRRLVQTREELGKRYQRARKDYFKDSWLRW